VRSPLLCVDFPAPIRADTVCGTGLSASQFQSAAETPQKQDERAVAARTIALDDDESDAVAEYALDWDTPSVSCHRLSSFTCALVLGRYTAFICKELKVRRAIDSCTRLRMPRIRRAGF